jgi:hypothetical protein
MVVSASSRSARLGPETLPSVIGMYLLQWPAGQMVQLLIIHNSLTDTF